MNTELLASLIVAHLVGDFLLQNNTMAKYKASSTAVCFWHVATYSIVITAVLLSHGYGNHGLKGCLIVWCIAAQHFLQDRFQLHLKWMKWYGQTEPDRWPTGPLCVDQAFHIAFIWIIWRFIA